MKNDDIPTLDFHLAQTVALLRERWYEPGTGCVAACLLSDAAPIYDVSRDIGHNLYSHAERNVLETYVREQGHLPPSDSILVTTLSPCVGSTSWRVGESCSDLAAAFGIRRLHVGLVDPDHPPHETGNSFQVTETKNPELAGICTNLRGLFNLKAPRQPDGRPGRLAEAYKSPAVFKAAFGV